MNSRESFYQRLRDELKSVDEQGLFKRERIIASPQDTGVPIGRRLPYTKIRPVKMTVSTKENRKA